MKIAIVGAGCSGLFAAYKLIDNSSLEIDIYEKGNPVDKRSRKEVLSGFGGAGAFSDGKLTLTTAFGGWLSEYISEDDLEKLIDEVDKIWRKLSSVETLDNKWDYEKVKDLEYLCSRYKLRLYPSKIRHLGTDNALKAIKNLENIILSRKNVRLFCNKELVDLIIDDEKILGIVTNDNKKIYYDKVILAVGRSGNYKMQELAEKYNISRDINPVDIGVRVELPRSITDYFTDVLYEFKIKYFTTYFEDEVRSFCVNPGGYVALERNDGSILTVNGHCFKNKKSDNTNFALLVSTKFTDPFREPVKYGMYISNLANMLSGGTVILQRFGDFIKGRRSTEKRISKNYVLPTLKEAMPGDLSFVIPYRYLEDIKETIYQLDKVMPGLADPSTLLYGIEAKFYSMRIHVDKSMRSVDIDNLYCVGDGAGLTRGIVQACSSGIIAAQDILNSAL
ncbi:MAG: FAD-dependent oxidoreductase [Deferribacterota bacterium]|nr:FAD-dependent oxidoreductase [Deferribacterota bacterium]